jgi:hypothetical protein
MAKIQGWILISSVLALNSCFSAPKRTALEVEASIDGQGYVSFDRQSYAGEVIFHVPKGSKLVGFTGTRSSLLGEIHQSLYSRFFQGGTAVELWILFRREGVRAGFDKESYDYNLETEQDRFKVLGRAYGLARDLAGE